MDRAPKRPAAVTWLLVGVLTFTGLAWLRFAGALVDWRFLSNLPLRVPVAYLALSGLLWGLAGTLLAWGLWVRKAWAPRALRLAAVAYALYYWFDRLGLAANGPQNANRNFALLITLALLAWIYASLYPAQVRAYFGDKHERT